MSENWLPIAGFEERYEVSSLGRVRSKLAWRGQLGRILSPAADEDGRLHVNLSIRPGVRRTAKVHRLVALAFIGPEPPGMQVCHWDGNPSNNRVSNLRWGTGSDNAQDAIRHGTNAHVAKTHCVNGHRLSAPNLTACGQRRGARNCLACARARAALQKAPGDLRACADQKYAQIMRGHLDRLADAINAGVR